MEWPAGGNSLVTARRPQASGSRQGQGVSDVEGAFGKVGAWYLKVRSGGGEDC